MLALKALVAPVRMPAGSATAVCRYPSSGVRRHVDDVWKDEASVWKAYRSRQTPCSCEFWCGRQISVCLVVALAMGISRIAHPGRLHAWT